MKESSWKERTPKRRIIVETISSAKTARIRGLGVTFSSHHFTWNHNFSAVASFLTFSEASVSH